ncbi:MAG: family 20 glycosylhydrolase [Verrucomicrobiota bacterium]
MIPNLFISEDPAVALRGVHLDLKGLPPTPSRLLELLEVFAAAHYNAVLVEWEDMFPWTVDERFRSTSAYTLEQVAAFAGKAKELGLEIIPLVQTLGHMETFLGIPGNETLQEVPGRPDGLNPLAKGSFELVDGLVEDALRLTPGVRFFHLGGDEHWTFGSHPDTKAFISEKGQAELLLEFLGPLMDKLNARGIRPILWHDMMEKWDDPSLARLSSKADLMVWGYGDCNRPEGMLPYYDPQLVERFTQSGLKLWGASAYKGADGETADLPDYAARENSTQAWVNLNKTHDLAGIVATGWSRYSTHRPQNEPIDSALDALLNSGIILHEGSPPEGGRQACLEALRNIPAAAGFDEWHAAIRELDHARRRSWDNIVCLREHLARIEAKPANASSQVIRQTHAKLGKWLEHLEQAAESVKALFSELITRSHLKEYLFTHIQAVRNEFNSIGRAIEKESHAAD